MHALPRIALISILSQFAASSLCELESFGGDDLVEGVCAAGEFFAGVAVAGNVYVSFL